MTSDKTRAIDKNEIAAIFEDNHPKGGTICGEALNYYHKLLIKTETAFNEHDIKEESTVIGRSPDSDIPINDGTVSGYHAAILIKGDECILRDLESRNGTFIYNYGKKQWEIAYQQRLQRYDKIKIGSERFMFIPGKSSFSIEEINRRFEDEPAKETAKKLLIGLLGLCGIIFFLIILVLFLESPEPPETNSSEPTASETTH
jgi:pSer/pThr/pTyr-binding forkhead associated (FHA) protein